uniref:Uncharacterized protein n=1 Tax=Apis cerana TaxID=7461 RepID=V9IM15_APICE
MNHFKCILDRTSRCELRRLQSSLSVSNSKIQIPARIKRDPTDILHALESTIVKDSSLHIMKDYLYHDDPYLLPSKNWIIVFMHYHMNQVKKLQCGFIMNIAIYFQNIFQIQKLRHLNHFILIKIKYQKKYYYLLYLNVKCLMLYISISY